MARDSVRLTMDGWSRLSGLVFVSTALSTVRLVSPANEGGFLTRLPARLTGDVIRCLAEITGGPRSPSGLALAIIVSAVLHAGFLLLDHRLLFTMEAGTGIYAKIVKASLTSAAQPRLVSDSVRENRPKGVATSPSAWAEQGHKSQATSDRVSPELETTPEVGAVVRESEVIPSFGARYFKGSELTQRPQPVEPVELSYPALVLSQNDERSGTVILRLLIAETGAVDQVLVESSDLPTAFQDETILRFAQARFTPGQIDGMDVKSQMRIEVTFSSRV